MNKSILTIDIPTGCLFCPFVKTDDFDALFHNYSAKKPYMVMSCQFCNGVQFIYKLTDELLTYKHKECPLKEYKEQADGNDNC